MSPLLYRFVTSALSPVLPFVLRRRAARGKEDAARLPERFGRASLERPAGPLIWLHGASVGETQMLRPLVDRLLEADPERHVLVTSGTVTAAHLMARQLPGRALHQYLPVDTPRATARFIAHWHPDLAVLAESEIWPNLIWTADRADIPIALINGRMSERSLRGWQTRRRMARSLFPRMKLLLAADARTATGLSVVSGRAVADVGSLKYDAPPLPFDRAESERLRAAIGDRPVWLAASTHAEEEAVFARLARQLDAFTLWLPRHPERGPAVAQRTGLPLRSQGQTPSERGYVMDTLGEMGLALSLADVCLMGGSFDPSLMGHNPLEAARAGVPVLTGPHMDSFSALYDAMQESGAVRVVSEAEAADALRAGMTGELSGMAAAAQRFAATQTGALDRTVAALEALLASA